MVYPLDRPNTRPSTKSPPTPLARFLVDERLRAGVSGLTLCRKLGFKKSAYYNLENGVGVLDFEQFAKLAEFYGSRLDKFYNRFLLYKL